MAQKTPTLQDYEDHISHLFAQEDEALRLAREDTHKAGMPPISVSATEGKLLHVLTRSVGARRILEIGTLGGYSAIWLARALPAGGRLVSLELDAHHSEVAEKNIGRAGLSKVVEIRVGDGLASLAKMTAAGEPAFDVAFIDADKEGYPDYLDAVYPMVRTGGLILADNTLRLDAPPAAGIPRYNAAVARHPGLNSIIIPVLRGDGLDGLLVSVKTGA